MCCLAGACLLASSASLAQPRALRNTIADALVVPTGTGFVAYRWPREPETIALYFGADWCVPCHAFMPELKQVHATLRAAGADTQVVYVSLDESEREMRRYMRRQQMPWPAIDYRRLRALPAVRALGGIAPPNLVLIDRHGRVIASGWQGRRYTGLAPVLKAWTASAALPTEHTGPSPRVQDMQRPLPSPPPGHGGKDDRKQERFHPEFQQR